MANPVCSNVTLNLPCFKGEVLNRRQRLAFRIWYMANELKMIGGTDYTAKLVIPGAGGLLDDTKQLFDKYSEDDMDAARTAIAFDDAVAAGAAVSSTPNVTINSVKHMVNNLNEITLHKMETLLMCKLGVHKTYPQ